MIYSVCHCAVGVKANVLQYIGFERQVAALLILPKRWHFYSFISRFIVALSFFSMTGNVEYMQSRRLRVSNLSNR
jgi:hypothetical protein